MRERGPFDLMLDSAMMRNTSLNPAFLLLMWLEHVRGVCVAGQLTQCLSELRVLNFRWSLTRLWVEISR